MREHEHLISSHNKEMQELRDALSLAMEKFHSLYQKSAMDLNEFKTYSSCTLGLLKERLLANETTIEQQKSTIAALHDQLMGFHVVYCTRTDTEKFQKELEAQIREASRSYLSSFQGFEKDLKTLLSCLKDDLEKLRSDMEKRVSNVSEKLEKASIIARLDKEGVLRELRIYEKSMFIIEKKIENIYTLIERINKRGEACHRPE